MRLIDSLAEQRHRQIVSHALPHIDEGEEVERWVRARHRTRRAEGFVYATERRLIVVMRGRANGHRIMLWDDIHAWGVDNSARGGPVLGVEADGEPLFVRLPVHTGAAAANVRSFLDFFARHAPDGSRSLSGDARGTEFVARGDVDVPVHKRSVAGHTMRVLVTVLGVVLVVGGILITPLPGPWSFPLILAGLAVLGSEYDWAKDALDWVKAKYRATKDRLTRRSAE